MKIRFSKLAAFVAAVLLVTAPVAAQVTNSATVLGRVTDSSGAAVPGTAIVITQSQTNVQWRTTTDANGDYVFSDLPVGTYSIAVDKTGFNKSAITSVVLNAAQSLRINPVLRPGDVAQTVQVSDHPITVDTVTANVGEIIDSQQMQALPLVTRNFITMLNLVPGVVSTAGSENGFASNSNLEASVNGVRDNANTWTIDGVQNQDVYNGNNAIVPNMDALAEFRVDRGNYSAEQGRNAGGAINVILKSGTNQFHGSAFEYLRNAAMNANSYFNNLFGAPRPADNYNNWGYTVGGPIVKNRLFFFWSEEWRRMVLPNSYHFRVPTDLERAGDFSEYATTGIAQPIVTSALASNPNCTGCVPGQPFPDNKIPQGVLNSNALALVNIFFPAAQGYNSTTASNLSSFLPNVTTVREELIRLDYSLNDRWKFFTHFIYDHNNVSSPYSLWGGGLPGVTATDENEPLQSFALNATGVLTPNLVNEAEFGIYHNNIDISISPLSSRSRASGLDIPYYFPNHSNAGDRIPNLYLQGYSGISIGFPFQNMFFYYQWKDNLSWHKGHHNLRFGTAITYQGKTENNSNSGTNGSLSFSGTQTGNALADMLTGFADNYSETENNPTQHLRYWDVEGYAQDQWQVKPRLSLTYGVRYTYYGPVIDALNLLSTFSPSEYQSAKAPTVTGSGSLSNVQPSDIVNGLYLPSNGIIVAGHSSPYGKAIYTTPKLNWSPRIGFSYDLSGRGTSVLRAGYGRYFDRTAPYELGMKSNPPFNSTVTIYSTSVNDPGNTGSLGAYYPVGVSGYTADQKLPYSQQWSLGMQQEVAPNTVMDVSYVGTKGTHLLWVNQVNQNTQSAALAEFAPGININQFRPYKGYQAIGLYDPSATSIYHGLQASLRHQFGQKFTLNLGYTFSKVLTDAPYDYSSPQDAHNLHADYGPANFDRTNMLSLNYVWSLPSLRGYGFAPARVVLGGWQWSGIVTVHSGIPLTVANGVYFNSSVQDSAQRPDQIGTAQLQKGLQWLNPGSFSIPAKGTFGNERVGTGRDPRQTQFDTSLFKSIPLPLYREMSLELRAEAINALNHTLLDDVNTYFYPENPSFGLVQATGAPRTMQIGLRLAF